MNKPISNSFTLQDNGLKVVKADVTSILTKTKRIRVGEETPAFAFYVCGFSDGIDNFERFDMSPNIPFINLYKTEAEVKEYCEGKVVSYREFYADSEQEIDNLIAKNKEATEKRLRSMYEAD